jgi:hypothetical protein
MLAAVVIATLPSRWQAASTQPEAMPATNTKRGYGGRRIEKYSTKKKAVTIALQEYVLRHKHLVLLHLFGTIHFDADYDVRRSRSLGRMGVEG